MWPVRCWYISSCDKFFSRRVNVNGRPFVLAYMRQVPDESFLKALFAKFLDNRCSPEEIRLLMDYADKEGYREIFSGLVSQAGMNNNQSDEALYALHKEAIDAVSAGITPPIPARKPAVHWGNRYRAAAAAALLLLAAGAGFWYAHPGGRNAPVQNEMTKAVPARRDLQPAEQKAVLILADGAAITLDSAANGMLTRQGHTQVIKPAAGSLVYAAGAGQSSGPLYNSVITPRGGQYQVTLPDGTRVWMNAASSLRFPTAFTGGVRQVTLTGEAYFEVAKDAGHPFVVAVNDMKVTVLGTHFNVMAYGDEAAVNTTLLEGSVKVTEGNNTALLLPGEQAQADRKGNIRLVRNADMNAAMAWKNRLFWFDHDDIRTVMRQISREYNVDVEIRGDIQRHFTGSIPRNVNVSTVFEVLQQTGGVHFTIGNEKIIVTP